MPSIEEVLKATGLSDEQIKALDAKVVQGLTQWGDGIVGTSNQLKEAAELKERQVRDMIAKEVNPALNNWENEKAAYAAREAAYKQAFEAAKAGGFIAPDINVQIPTSPTSDPNNPPRNAQGQFVAGQNPIPGSPQYLTPQQALRLQNESLWLVGEHMRLHGQPLPDDLETIIKEADAQHMSFRDYASKKYNFDAKRQEFAAKKTADERAALTKEIESKVRQEYAEKNGNNAGIRPAVTSEYSQVSKAVQAGTRPDPLKQTRDERARTTREMIDKDLREAQVQ